MYVVESSAFNELYPQLLNAFDHAAGTYYLQQLDKLI